MHSFRHNHVLQILKTRDRVPLDRHVQAYLRQQPSVGASDRRAIYDTAFGLVRWQLYIDHRLGTAVPKTWEHRLDAFQRWQCQGCPLDSSYPLHVQVSHPKDLYDLLVRQYGDTRARELAEINNEPASFTIRINALKITREKWVERFGAKYEHELCKSPLAVTLRKRINLSHLQEFKDGLFEVQDEGSQMLADLVDVKPKESVLDYCAGAGGKTLAYAVKMRNKGAAYLYDLRPAALKEAEKRLKRAGITNAKVLLRAEELASLRGRLDWVMVDAPCSGTGTLRRQPEARYDFSLETLERLQYEQKKIVSDALALLKKEGRLVYGTCSVLQQENEDQVDFFTRHFGLALAAPPLKITPITGGTDGYFGVVLARRRPTTTS